MILIISCVAIYKENDKSCNVIVAKINDNYCSLQIKQDDKEIYYCGLKIDELEERFRQLLNYKPNTQWTILKDAWEPEPWGIFSTYPQKIINVYRSLKSKKTER